MVGSLSQVRGNQVFGRQMLWIWCANIGGLEVDLISDDFLLNFSL